MAKTAIHPFESFGPAPYTIVGVTEKVFVIPGVCVKAGGSCDVCGTGIRWSYKIRAANGVEFVTGCDCAEKAGMSAKSLVEARRSYMRECWERESAKERNARLDAQRARNNGLTDAEREQAIANGVAFARARLKRERAYDATHLGTVGKRMRGVEAIVEHTHTFETHYGPKTIWILRDRAGNQIVVKTSSGIGVESKGESYSYEPVSRYNQKTGERFSRWFMFDGTVSEHGEYNGMRQTVMQRVKATAIKSDWIDRNEVKEMTYRRAH